MAEKQYYSIGEVAQMLGVNLSLLRFWEKEFPFIAPKKNARGTRLYSNENLNDIKLVYHLVKEKKLTLEGAKKQLKENRDGTVKNHEIILKLKDIKSEITAIKESFDLIISEAGDSQE
ncbi:MAG: MerR family transcriptional regulator [Paludibacteraceae bacterium]